MGTNRKITLKHGALGSRQCPHHGHVFRPGPLLEQAFFKPHALWRSMIVRKADELERLVFTDGLVWRTDTRKLENKRCVRKADEFERLVSTDNLV